MLLNGTEMNTKSHREKFGLKSHFRVIPRDFGKLKQGDISAEIEEIVHPQIICLLTNMLKVEYFIF